MTIKKFLSFIFVALCLSVLVACYGGDEESSSEQTKGENNGEETEQEQDSGSNTLRLAAIGEIPTLKTNGQMDGLSQTIILNIFEGLYRLGPDHEPIEGIAKKHEVSEDGKKYTIHLKEDAVWSNGDPVTAHDFVYAWRKALHPETFSPHAYMMNPIKNAEELQNPDSDIYGKVDKLGVKAVDDYTLKVVLEYGVTYFIDLLTHPVFFPQNEKFVEEQGDNYALEPENLIFNGPFVLESWDHGQGWVLQKNPDYWDAETVKVDTLDFKVVKDTSTEVNLYEANTIDVANLSSEFVDIYKDSEEYTTTINDEVYFMRLNQQNEYLSNVNIRKAIDMAWNKKQATEAILKNGSIPANWLVPPNYVESPEGQDFRERYGDLNKGSVEEAQKLWEKGLEELGKSEVSLELLSYDDGQRSSVAEYIKNQLEKNLPGLTITINQQPNKQKLALEDKQDYAISFSGWRGGLNAIEFLEVFLSDGPYNWQDFKNEEYDKLVKKAQTDFSDPSQRFKNLQEAERILIDEEAAISPIYQSSSSRLIQPYVKGFTAHPDNTITYKWISIEK